MKNNTIITWQNYWKIFDDLIKLLNTDYKTKIVSEFEDAKKHVNGLTDGWHEFKFSFEKTLKFNSQSMSQQQNQIANLLLTTINEVLNNG